MAGVLTDVGERALLDFILRGVDTNVTSHRYLGLSTTAWNDSGSGGTEPTDSAYARQLVTMSLSGRSSDIQNSNTITFPTATEDWGTIAYWALFPDTSSSTPRLTGTLDVSRVCNSGDSIVITPNQIDFTIESDDADNFIQYFYRQRYLYAMIHGVTEADYEFTSDGSGSDGGYVNSTSLGSNTQVSIPGFLNHTNTRTSIGLLKVDPSTISTTTYTNGRISNRSTYHYNNITDVNGYGIAQHEPFANISTSSYPHNMTTVSNSLNRSNGYAREAVSFNSASTSSGVTSITNSSTITFNTATQNWGTIYGWAIYANLVNQQQFTIDQRVAGSVSTADEADEVFFHLHPIMVGKFNTSRTVNANDVFRINAGDLVIRFD